MKNKSLLLVVVMLIAVFRWDYAVGGYAYEIRHLEPNKIILVSVVSMYANSDNQVKALGDGITEVAKKYQIVSITPIPGTWNVIILVNKKRLIE